jgi:hypothetical protein
VNPEADRLALLEFNKQGLTDLVQVLALEGFGPADKPLKAGPEWMPKDAALHLGGTAG